MSLTACRPLLTNCDLTFFLKYLFFSEVTLIFIKYNQIKASLVVFAKNEGNFREKKIFQKNVKSQFVNGGLHVVRLIS